MCGGGKCRPLARKYLHEYLHVFVYRSFVWKMGTLGKLSSRTCRGPLLATAAESMFSLMHGFWKMFFARTEFQILILGIDRAGKTVRLPLRLGTSGMW